MNRYDNLPGTGNYIAYYKPDNRKVRPVEFRLPEDFVGDMKPDFDKIKELNDEACLLYVKAWTLADKRCREIIQEGSVSTLGRNPKKDAEYSYEQGVIRRKLLEIEAEANKLMYGQYRKGLESGLLPEEVSTLMTGALAAYDELGLPALKKLIASAKKAEDELYRKKNECEPDEKIGASDVAMECAKAQQKAYQCCTAMDHILRIKPFYDGSWVYFGNDVVDRKAFDNASKHDCAWAMAVAECHGGTSGDSTETFKYMESKIKLEYGI